MWCVRRRTERRSRGGCFFCHSRTSIARTGGRAREISGCAPRDCQLLAELAAVFTAGRGEIRGFKPSGRHPSRFASTARRARKAKPGTTASDFSGRKKITRRCSCDVRSIRRRVASDESGRALSTRVERIRARGHVARASERGAGRHAFARPRRAREATLDSVSE